MRLLVLGGTVFLGRHLVEAALAAGDEVTIFHRGRSNPGLFEGVETLIGDRNGNLEPLQGRRWDAVIDTSGFLPRIVRASAALLAPSVGSYTFISSGSVYADDATPNQDESAPVQTLSQEGSENIPQDYGALKALCEREVEQAFPGRALHVRFGLLVGPYDPTNRFTYWPRHIAEGGEILAPGSPQQRVQFIDARDGARWILDSVRSRRAGVFNVTGPDLPLTMENLLETTRETVGSNASLTWVEESFLLAHDVAPWTDLPPPCRGPSPSASTKPSPPA